MKKVLIITYAFPPSNTAAVQRVLRLGRWLPKYGWEPVILTPQYRHSSIYDYENNIIKEKYFNNVYKVSYKLELLISKITDSTRRDIFSRFIRGFIFPHMVPDQFFPWYFPAIKEGMKIIEKENIDAIWATVNPWTDGLIGSYISRKAGIPLLIDYRDPWTLSKFHKQSFFKKKINIIIEKRMLKHAKAICTTSKPMSQLFINNKYFDANMIFTITNCIDEELQYVNNSNSVFSTLNKDKINITYIGVFYGDRQPFTFIKALASLIEDEPDLRNKIQINFWGNREYNDIKKVCDDCNIFDMFSLKGFLSYKQSMGYLRESDILLLLNGKADHNYVFIPGKLFDYLAVRKPILFVGKGQPANIIKELNIGESANHDIDDIKEKLKKIIYTYKTMNINPKEIYKYSAENIAMKLSQIFNLISD